MMAIEAETRRYAAQLMRRHFEGTVTPEVLLENFGNSTDPLIQVSMYVVAHQPRRGFLGVSERHWRHVFWPRMNQLLLELEKGDGGIAPAQPPYPVASLGRLAGLLLFAIFVLAIAAEHIRNVVKHVSGATRLNDWRLLAELALSAFFSLAALAAVANLITRIRLRSSGSPETPTDAA